MATYEISELESWNERIFALVTEYGLDPYPQEFEICDHEQMLGYMAYSGMPSHYPHWSLDNFQTVQIQRKEDIWPSFKNFLSKDRLNKKMG